MSSNLDEIITTSEKLILSGKNEEAIRILSEAASTQPTNWQIYWLMAQAGKNINNLEIVDLASSVALKLNPEFWFARELPKHARGYYAQTDQDVVIEKFFQQHKPNSMVFAEVGAFDGVHYSNVRRLVEQYGWSGISVEPVEKNFKKLCASYKGKPVTCIRCAVADKEGFADLNVSTYPHLPEWGSDVASLGDAEMPKWDRYGAVWCKERVPVKTLTSILREQNINKIDLLSVDAEGHDLDVLKGLDFNIYHPTLIVVEYGDNRQAIFDFLADNDYQLVQDNGQDLFMQRLPPVKEALLTEVYSLIHPHLLETHYLDEIKLSKDFISPGNLINAKRFDILAKLVFARLSQNNYDTSFGKELYREHLAIFNGFQETNEKVGFERFVEDFQSTLRSIQTNGFSEQTSLVPIDATGIIIDGAHRAAACIYYDKPVHVLRCDRIAPVYDFQWFRNRGLSEDACDAMAQEYIRWSPNSLIVTLFPAAQENRDEEALQILRTQGEIVYGNKMEIHGDGPALLIWQMYRDESWIGESLQRWPGSRGKAAGCFPAGSGVVRVFLFEPKSGADLRLLKESIRAIYGVKNHSIHINDFHKETEVLGSIYFNANSRHFLNNARMDCLPNFWSLFNGFTAGLNKQDADPDQFCIDGSAILSAYGLRDCRDIDFLHTGPDEYSFGDPGLIGSHNLCAAHHVTSIDDILFNPANHFYFHGIRFGSLGILREMKLKRGEGKDLVDVALIDGLKEAPPKPHRQNNPVKRPFNWKDRPTKIVGLLTLRNESAIIARTLQSLSPIVDAMVILDDASTDNTVQICQSYADYCKIEHIIRKKTGHKDEAGDRNRLLNVGRYIGGTHFIMIAAGECFTSNLQQDSLLRRNLLNLEPGDILEMQELHLAHSTYEYRNGTDFNSNFKAIAFRDNWSCHYVGDFSQKPLIPKGVAGRTIRINEPQAGLMRLKSANLETEPVSSLDEIRVQLSNILSFNQPKAFNNITDKIFSNPVAKSLFAKEIQLLGNQECIADFIPRLGLTTQTAQMLSSSSCRIGYLGASVSAQNESYVNPLHQFIQKVTAQEHQQILCAYGAMGCLAALQKVGAELFAFKPNICFIELLTGDMNDGLTPIEEIEPALEAIIRLAREAQCEPIFLNLFRADQLFSSSNPWLASYENVATHYGVPSINVCSAIFKGLCAGELELETILKDSVHTTPNGSHLVASLAGSHFSSLLQNCQPRHQYTIPLKYAPRYLGTETQYPTGDPHHFFKSQQVWQINVPGGELSLPGQGYFAGLQIVVGPNSGIVEVEICSIGYRQQFSTWDHWCYHGERFHFLPIGQDVPANSTITLRSVRHNRIWCGFCHHKSKDGTIQLQALMPGWDSFLPRETPCSEHDVPAPQEPTIQIVSAFFGLNKYPSMPEQKNPVQGESAISPRVILQKPFDLKAGTPKIVGLVPARNEKHIIGQCLRALSLFTDAIVYLDDASTDETLSIVESLASECRIERIIRKKEWYRDEPGDRNAMLKAGREIGGTHFIVIDADEMLTSNLAGTNGLKEIILKLQPGDRLALNWIQLWRSVDNYRFDNSVWTWNYKEIVFCDEGDCSYSSEFIHTPRVPVNMRGRCYKLEGYEGGLLHFQFVNWRNLLLKQSWYRCLEHIREPGKSVQDINKRYAPSKDESGLGLKPAPANWLSGYTFFDRTVYDRSDEWREEQIMGWFRQYGRDCFVGLDIWDVTWEEGKRSASGTWLATKLTTKAAPNNMIEVNGVLGYLSEGDMGFLRHSVSRVKPGGVIVEIGSFLGLSALTIAHELYLRGDTSTKVYCVDSWQDSSTSYQHAEKGGFRQNFFKTFSDNVKNSGLSSYIVPINDISTLAASRLADQSIDLLFVDGDHSFKSSYEDLSAWIGKVKPDGILIGHDCTPTGGVRQAVIKFCSERGVNYVIHEPPLCHYMYEFDVKAFSRQKDDNSYLLNRSKV